MHDTIKQLTSNHGLHHAFRGKKSQKAQLTLILDQYAKGKKNKNQSDLETTGGYFNWNTDQTLTSGFHAHALVQYVKKNNFLVPDLKVTIENAIAMQISHSSNAT